MMKYQLALGLSVLAALFVCSATARADVHLEVAALIGTGVDTGKADNNPYALQIGALGELNINDLVLGVRGTRSLRNDDKCAGCREVKGLRTFGGDVGFDWNLAILRLGPRFGFGYINEKDGSRTAGYIEPGGAAEVGIGLFVAGVDLRYRVALKESDLSAFLAYLRLGLRF